MSFEVPGFIIPRQPVDGMEGMFAKMWDPPNRSPSTPDLMTPTNPVPEVMAAAGIQNIPHLAHTVNRDLLSGLSMLTWDGLKNLSFMVFADSDNPDGSRRFPASTIRVPRGVIFHCETQGKGPPPHTIHWHGIEPTPMNDGVGHCSMEIGQYTYQWQPNHIGTYFYHCHRNTVQHFEFGLYGMLHVEPPDAYFATQQDPSIPIGACRDGKHRIAANLPYFPQFPGFNSNLIDAPDPWTGDPNLLFSTDPHAMTVPYDVEALWVLDDRDSIWSDLAPNATSTYPKHGSVPGVNDQFHGNAGGVVGPTNFFAFNDFNADYWFISGVPVPAHRGGTAAIPAGVVIPPALNSGVSGQQVSINARVGQTILIRCLDAAYNNIELTLPVDVVIIAWDGRALGVPPYGQYNHAYRVPAGTPIEFSVARRFDALIRATFPISSYATVKFIDTRGLVPGFPKNVLVTARIPINITAAQAGAFSISGSVINSQAGAPIAGVQVNLSGATGNLATTDASGNYSFSGLANGRYTVIPSHPDFSFSPREREVPIDGSSQIGQFFRGRRP